MPGRRALPRSRRGIRDRALPRVVVLTVVMASLVGLVGVLVGTYVMARTTFGAQTGTSLAVPRTAADAGSPSSASASSALGDSATPTSETTSPTAATTTVSRATTSRVTKATSPAARTSTATGRTSSAGTMEKQVLALTNTQRVAAGCPALVWNDTLAAVARAHSADMAANNYFDHTNKAGLTPARRVLAAGYSYTLTAENIAAGQTTAQDVLTGWMNSAGHKANIVNCALRELGVGFATGGSYGTYWTQDFGTR